MPIRRAAATPTQEKAPSAAAQKEPEASDEESPSADDEQAASSAARAEDEEGENSGDVHPDKNEDNAEEEGVEEDKKDKKEMKDGYKYEKSKTKKVKRTIPAWASVTSNKNIPVTNFAGTQYKMDSILIEAIMSSTDKAGISFQSLMKYILKKYPKMEVDKKKFLIKKAMKKHVAKGTIKQLKGKGLSGRFAIGKNPPPSKKGAQKQESLGDALPLIFTRLCEPKEASYTLIKKYLKQHFPNFNIENRPDVLKTALGKAVEKGHLEQVTGKGASGTFQLKHTSKDAQLKGSTLEDAITVAIIAMNEPKTCSATSLRRYLIDSNKDVKERVLVTNLKRTLTKCKVLGWMKQLTGHGLNGTFVLSFPYYPSPTILYPEKFKELPKKPTKRRQTVDTSDEDEEEEEEEESEDEAPSRKRRTKMLSHTDRRPPPAKRSQRTTQSKARSRARAPAKSPLKTAASSAKRTGKKPTPAKKESTATPVKRGAPSRKPKKPAVKKLSKRVTRKPVYKESSPEPESEPEESEAEEETTTRGGSKRSKPSEPEVAKGTKKAGSRRSKPESSPKEPKAEMATARGGSKRSKPEDSTPEEPPVKKQATKGGSKRPEPESSPGKPDVKKDVKSSKQSTRKSKRGKN
ncbi:heterochromatin protein 1-binding protein 3 isoform X2 [Kryptolebias marmoratus]|uniref:Heterochromatin protein 1-binding protein 3 n=1 Tax=Kryptolebias marmoratus TaxID=37003 RepID=A0A3Q3BEM9_KRYMA|nr:heterochromatin protein 1-binding protein 3 isoform X2 [Kryptolebias marmoratus]